MADHRLDEARSNLKAAALTRLGALMLATLAATIAACGGGGDAPAQSVAPARAPAPAAQPTTPADAVNGRVLYSRHCSACHQATPDERVLAAAGDGSVVLQAIGLVRIMNFLSLQIRPAEAQDIGLWLQDPR